MGLSLAFNEIIGIIIRDDREPIMRRIGELWNLGVHEVRIEIVFKDGSKMNFEHNSEPIQTGST